MKTIKYSLLFVLIANIGPISQTMADEIPPAQLAFFEKEVRPLLADHCYKCHSSQAKNVKGGLRLDTREGVLQGGETGPAIIPRKGNESLLIQAVTHKHDQLSMPPKKTLSNEQIAILRRWINMGAPDPRTPKITSVAASSIDYEKGRQFWAFKAPIKTSPTLKNTDWPKTNIDHHIMAALEQKNVPPVSDADRRTLVRRAYYDLIGLPPTPEQVQQFLDDTLEGAFARLVDQLLAQPQFGERWGRHWLDVARYAESTGMERNYTYPVAWRYRDYVIDAFNQDKPFDQFIREQIAGDLLSPTDVEQEAEQLVATTFLAMGPKSLNERNREVFTMDIVDEQIDVTTRAFMGLTVSCARCHDHKFDPISQMDYYSIAGFFTNTKTHFGTKGGGGNRQPSTLIPIGKDGKERAAQAATQTKNLKQAQAQISKLQKVVKSKMPPDASKTQKWMEQKSDAKERLTEIQAQIKKLRTTSVPTFEQTMGVHDLPTARDTHLRIRGDVNEKGPLAQRGFLPVISKNPYPEIPTNRSGRQQLARWIASPENPLTARVMANRIWKHLFGEGIVRTVDNFGETGERPSNPELLDYLAIQLADSGWSTKGLIREIMLSRTYQLSSEYDETLREADPDNRLFGRMNHRRLDAEAIRDAILFTSNSLDLTPASASPVAGVGSVNIGQNIKLQEKLKTPEFRQKRSVYQPVVRNLDRKFLKTFDFAESSIIVGRRDITTVPTQALLMMNSKAVSTYAMALAQRIIKESDSSSLEDIINTLYAHTLNRAPQSEERERILEFLSSLKNIEQTERWSLVAQALYASAEFRYLE